MPNLKFIFRAYRYRFLIDPPEIRYIRQNLKTGATAIDIGCHKGGYLYWLRESVGSRGRVFAFEPQPKLFRYLNETVGDSQTVVLENKGLSSAPGVLDFHIPVTKSGSSPGARIGSFSGEEQVNTIKIDVVTLDDYFLTKNIAPSLIKIDVEGHEKAVLEGGLELLKKHRPKILMECEARHLNGASVFEVFQLLLDIGYQGYFFENGRLNPLSAFNPDVHQKAGDGRFWEAPGYVNNFVFEF
ncbi:MAG: FkbM family methyltransferase [Saprospiraceae bacterium]